MNNPKNDRTRNTNVSSSTETDAPKVETRAERLASIEKQMLAIPGFTPEMVAAHLASLTASEKAPARAAILDGMGKASVKLFEVPAIKASLDILEGELFVMEITITDGLPVFKERAISKVKVRSGESSNSGAPGKKPVFRVTNKAGKVLESSSFQKLATHCGVEVGTSSANRKCVEAHESDPTVFPFPVCVDGRKVEIARPATGAVFVVVGEIASKVEAPATAPETAEASK